MWTQNWLWNLCSYSNNNNTENYLARSSKLPTGLYILLALISFFFILFLMISRRTIISGSTAPIFAIFSPNENEKKQNEMADWYHVHSLHVRQVEHGHVSLLPATLRRRAGYALGCATHFQFVTNWPSGPNTVDWRPNRPCSMSFMTAIAVITLDMLPMRISAHGVISRYRLAWP